MIFLPQMTQMGTDGWSDGRWFLEWESGGERVNRIWAMALLKA